jgi:hypothetical protein
MTSWYAPRDSAHAPLGGGDRCLCDDCTFTGFTADELAAIHGEEGGLDSHEILYQGAEERRHDEGGQP